MYDKDLQYILKAKKVSDELLEQLSSSLQWLLRYSEKYNIPLPEKDRIMLLIDRAIETANKLPTNRTGSENNQKANTTAKLVENRIDDRSSVPYIPRL